MGIKKGTNLFSKGSLVESHLDNLRKQIIVEKGEVSSHEPDAMTYVNAWIIATLFNPHIDSKKSYGPCHRSIKECFKKDEFTQKAQMQYNLLH